MTEFDNLDLTAWRMDQVVLQIQHLKEFPESEALTPEEKKELDETIKSTKAMAKVLRKRRDSI